MKKGLLPIGTVVILEDGTKKVMITGYYSKAEGENKIYQYNGCIFPEGFMENVFCLFDQSQIVEVFYKGLENDEYENYVKDISSKLSNSSSQNISIFSNNNDKNSSHRIPERPPKHPMSKSEMVAKFGVSKESKID